MTECPECEHDEVRKIFRMNPVFVYECLSCGEVFKESKEGESE